MYKPISKQQRRKFRYADNEKFQRIQFLCFPSLVVAFSLFNTFQYCDESV